MLKLETKILLQQPVMVIINQELTRKGIQIPSMLGPKNSNINSDSSVGMVVPISMDMELLNFENRSNLEIGSVHIASKLFLIRPWTPFIEQQIESIKTVPIWMILRGVPLHLWNAYGFSKIASLVGKPIMTDAPTAMKTRMGFARICVEVDADCKYPAKLPFRIDDKKYEVRAEYAWKPSSCCHCKSFGHLSHNCSYNKKPKHTKTLSTPPSSVADPIPLNDTSKDIEEGIEVGGQPSIPLVTSAELVVSQLDVADASKQWKTFTKRKKKVGRKEDIMEAPTCSPNSFEVLSEEQECAREEDNQFDAKNREVGIDEEEFTNEDENASEEVPVEGEKVIQINPNNILNSELPFAILSEDENGMEEHALEDANNSMKTLGEESVLKDNSSERSDFETDNESMEVKKMKPLEEIPRRRPMTKEQKVDNLMNVSALLGVGGKKADMENVFSGIVERQSKINPEKELAKLNWPGVTNNDMLGKGKRTPSRKK